MCSPVELPGLGDSNVDSPQVTSAVSDGTVYAKAIFAYTPENDKELALMENDVVKILKLDSSGLSTWTNLIFQRLVES